MKIQPSVCKSGPLYPTLLAMAGSVFTGCDKQKAPGIVPFEQKNTPTEKQQQLPGAKWGKTSDKPEEPLKLGGEPIELPVKQGGDVPYTPDMDKNKCRGI